MTCNTDDESDVNYIEENYIDEHGNNKTRKENNRFQ